MPSIEDSIDIRRPVSEVFAALTDPRRGPEWNPGILEVRDISQYPVREGSSWEQTALVAGRKMTLRCRVVRYEPPHEGLIEVSGDQRGQVWTLCHEADGLTRVTQGIEFVPPGGPLGQAIAGMLSGAIHRELVATLKRQRDILEREPKGSHGSGPA